MEENEKLTLVEAAKGLHDLEARFLTLEARLAFSEGRTNSLERLMVELMVEGSPAKVSKRGTNPSNLSPEQKAEKHRQLVEGKRLARERREADAAAEAKAAEKDKPLKDRLQPKAKAKEKVEA